MGFNSGFKGLMLSRETIAICCENLLSAQMHYAGTMRRSWSYIKCDLQG